MAPIFGSAKSLVIGNSAMLNILESFRRWRTGKIAAAALSRMDDRILADIGISRSDISRFVRGPR